MQDETQRALVKGAFEATDFTTFVDLFSLPAPWLGMALDEHGCLPLCMACALALLDEGVELEWRGPGSPASVCDCCSSPQRDLDFEESALSNEFIDQGTSRELAYIRAADDIYSVLAFAADWDTQRTRWQQRGIEQ
jgi:hypothetical protein